MLFDISLRQFYLYIHKYWTFKLKYEMVTIFDVVVVLKHLLNLLLYDAPSYDIY